MTALQSLLVFIGIPVALAIVVFGLVSASQWTRGGRVDDDYSGDPFLIVSDPALPDPARLSGDLPSPFAGGGVSARW